MKLNSFFLPDDPSRRNLIIELRARIRLALGMMPDTWPMETFIHHNPLNGLEDLTFEDAVELGKELFGGKGYPDRGFFRESIRTGRISRQDLWETFPGETVGGRPETQSCQMGDRSVSFASFCAAQFLISPDLPFFAPEGPAGVGTPFDSSRIEGRQVARVLAKSVSELGMDCSEEMVREALNRLVPAIRQAMGGGSDSADKGILDPLVLMEQEMAMLGAKRTFSDWTDQLLGSSVREQVDRIMSDAAA
ncbi:MAG: putative inorganic carbon transporter subunit DabA, partial [Leptospirales bacterium]